MLNHISLKTRILLLVLSIQTGLLVALAAASLQNARQAVENEISAGTHMARSLVLATIGTMQDAVPADRLMAALPERLANPRHARITVLDAQDSVLRLASNPSAAADRTPGWFSRMIRPALPETRLPVVIRGRMLGYVLITADPAPEIAEVWRDLRLTLGLTALAALAQAGLILAALSAGLRPLERLSARLADLTRGDLSARVGAVALPDLAPLGRRIDRLADELQRGQSDRARLQRQVVSRGDEERKSIARDLHDEYGPCLFGLRVEADALRQASDDPTIAAHADAVDAIAAQIQNTNRALLADLRPPQLGQLPLATVLRDYVDDLSRRFPETQITLEIEGNLPEPDEPTALTLFRILQESTTNALRHSGGDRIKVVLSSGPSEYQISISDNGQGIAPDQPEGNGLSGMRERITLLGGSLGVVSDMNGCEIRAALPRDHVTP